MIGKTKMVTMCGCRGCRVKTLLWGENRIALESGRGRKIMLWGLRWEERTGSTPASRGRDPGSWCDVRNWLCLQACATVVSISALSGMLCCRSLPTPCQNIAAPPWRTKPPCSTWFSILNPPFFTPTKQRWERSWINTFQITGQVFLPFVSLSPN